MEMRKIGRLQLFTSMLLMMLLACNKKSDASLAGINLSISQSTLAFSEKDSIQSIQVVTDASDFAVTISPGSSWCSFKKNGTTVSISVSGMASSISQRSAIDQDHCREWSKAGRKNSYHYSKSYLEIVVGR